MNRSDPEDRFGVEIKTMTDEVESHRALGIHRIGCYVPTRREVATMSAADLGPILEFWMWEGPSTLIPNNVQIADVLAILLARDDAGELEELVGACREYPRV